MPELYQEARGSAPRSGRTQALVSEAGLDFRRLDAALEPGRWEVGFAAALADLLVNRLMFYVMIDRVRPLRFLPRIVRTWQRLHHLFGAAAGNGS